MRKIVAATVAAVWAATVFAADNPLSAASGPQNQPPARWHVSLAPADAKPGDEVEIVFTADIAPGWILYSSDFNLLIGPRPAKFTFDENAGLTLVGPIQPVNAKWKTDRSLGGKYSYFADHAQFRQKARLAATNVTGRITGQTCFEENGLCQLFQEKFSARTDDARGARSARKIGENSRAPRKGRGATRDGQAYSLRARGSRLTEDASVNVVTGASSASNCSMRSVNSFRNRA